MDRRRFAELSALALTGMSLPATRAQSFVPQLQGAAEGGAASDEPIGYALVGLGTICDIFGRGCQKLSGKNIKVTALVTGHADTKGKEWAARFGVPESSIYSYEDFDKIRSNKAVTAVYIGLPNSMHREYTVRAAKAGKHVLCEKPMAISSAECREMITACKESNLKLMIAYRCHYDPTHLEAERILQSGAIGTLESFEGAFGFNAPENHFWRLDPKLAGGGPIMDVGIYPLNAMRYFSREEPTAFTAAVSTRDHASGRFQGMEQTMEFTMTFPSGVAASVGTTYGANMPGFVRIHGSKGTLEIGPAFDYTGIHLRSLDPQVHADATSPDDETFHFQLEATHFANCIRSGATPRTPGEEGLKDLLAIEAIYRAAGHPIA